MHWNFPVVRAVHHAAGIPCDRLHIGTSKDRDREGKFLTVVYNKSVVLCGICAVGNLGVLLYVTWFSIKIKYAGAVASCLSLNVQLRVFLLITILYSHYAILSQCRRS